MNKECCRSTLSFHERSTALFVSKRSVVKSLYIFWVAVLSGFHTDDFTLRSSNTESRGSLERKREGVATCDGFPSLR